MFGQVSKQDQKHENESGFKIGNLVDSMAIQTVKFDQMGLRGQKDALSRDFARLRFPEIDLIMKSRGDLASESRSGQELRTWQDVRTVTDQIVRQGQIQRQITQQITEQVTVPDMIVTREWFVEFPPLGPPPGLPGMPGLGGGGSGGGYGWPERTGKYNYENPVTDIPYLESLVGRFGAMGARSNGIIDQFKKKKR